MTRKVNQTLWEQWRQRVERQRESGLSIAEFCRREGVSAVTFHTWKRKLQSATGTPLATKSAWRPPSARHPPAPRLRRPRAAQVGRADGTSSAAFLQLPVPAPRSGPWIELTLVEGTVIRIPQHNLAALQIVFTMLRGAEAPVTNKEVTHA